MVFLWFSYGFNSSSFLRGSREEALDAAGTAQQLAASAGDFETEVRKGAAMAIFVSMGIYEYSEYNYGHSWN